MKSKTLFVISLPLVLSLACSLLPIFSETAAPPTLAPAVAAESPVPASAPTVAASLAVCENEACMANGVTVNYLIVTRPLFADALIPFINWKTGQGYRVGLVTVDWLSARFPGRHMAESMKTGMHTLRRLSGGQYVLLVGDTEIERQQFDVEFVLSSYTLDKPWNVPTGFFRQLNSDPPRTVAASDAYFVEDLDWDPQNTGLNPRPENLDTGLGKLDATLFIGRWPVRTPEEIAPIFAKTQRLTPTNRIFFTRDNTFQALSVEEYQQQCPDLPFPAWYCYEFEHARLHLFGQNSPWLETQSLAIDVTDAAQGEDNYRRLFAFDGVIVELYHGSYDFLAMPKWEEALGEHDYRMLVVSSCMAFAFYSGSPDTASERILKSPSGPAIVTLSPNDYVFLMYVHEGQTVGQAFWRSGEILWNGSSSVLLGDPSLQVMTPQ